jgi:rhodanese-related sulfurtransferase
MREFDAEELQQHLESDTPFLLDVRQPWEYDVCRLENSTLIPMAQVPTNIDELDKERETVVICHHGIRSRNVACYLEQAGFSNVINLKGGVSAWAKKVDTTMATY